MALTDSQSADRAGRPPLADLFARLKAWRTDSDHHSIAQRMADAAFLIRVASAAILFVSQIAFARWMGSFEFGIYVYVWTWVVLLGGLAPLGIGYLAQRFIPEYVAKGDDATLRGYLVGSRWLCFGMGSAMALLGAGVVLALGDRIPDYYIFPFLVGLACLPMFAVGSAQDSIARSYNWIGIALVPAFLGRPVLVLAGMTVVLIAGLPASANAAIIVVAVVEWTAVLLQRELLQRRLARCVAPGPRRYEIGRWIRTALPVFLVEGFYLLLTHTDILVLQLYVTPDRVAVYYAAVKTMALVAFIYYAVSAACAHRFSEYHLSGDRERLAAFAGQATRWTFWPSLAITATLVVLGKPILMLFGPDFPAGYPLVCVLAIGLLTRASVGPAERLLIMLGEQRLCAAVYAASFLLNLSLCFVLIPRLGLMGAAVSTATALTMESMLLFWVAKARLGFHVFVWQPKAR